MPSDPKPFPCKECGWLLGESYREDGKRITQLRIFRITKDPKPVEPKGLPVPTAILYAAIGVNDCVVVCGHCGAKLSWYANQTAIEDMLSRKNNRKKKRVDEVIREPAA